MSKNANQILANQILQQLADGRFKAEGPFVGIDQFLDSIIENIPDMIFVKDAAELRFVRFNKAGEDLLGYSRDQLIGKNDYDFFPAREAEFFIQKDREVLHGRKLVEIAEEPIHTRLKGARILHTKKIPIYDANGEPAYLLGISEDITDRKQAEVKEQRNRELERSNAELDQFASIIAHDLREPMRMISIYMSLLQNEFREIISPVAKEYVDFAIKGTARMNSLLKDLLEYSQAGITREPIKPVNTIKVLNDVVQNLTASIESKNPEIEISNLPNVRGNYGQLIRLFQNLIENSLKYSGPQPIKIRVYAEESDQEWKFFVQDNGLGIEPRYHEKIFQIFQRLNPSDEVEGTGIGLSICRRIVENHGGKIGLFSELGKGATFFFTLPKEI
ncbi:MAG: PAS domain-containing protein [Deltaproteobacteria bacterium]|nr:PAS domain-containing protein [Deltaproteobacteria bacterium]